MRVSASDTRPRGIYASIAALAALLCAFVALVAAIPRGAVAIGDAEATASKGEQPAVRSIASLRPAAAIDAGKIARRFPGPRVVAAAAPAKLEAPVEKKAAKVIASWISYLGSIEVEGGDLQYIFKDGRNERIIRLVLGKKEAEWELVAIEEDGFTIEEDGKPYAAPYRR